MVLEDKHIAFLEAVRRGDIKYQVTNKSFYGPLDSVALNQTVAITMHRLGAIRIVKGVLKMSQSVVLTTHGEKILLEEGEAWA